MGLEACAEKTVNIVLDYNNASAADGDTTIFMYVSVWKSQVETLVCKNTNHIWWNDVLCDTGDFLLFGLSRL